jgi:hypothetical protein
MSPPTSEQRLDALRTWRKLYDRAGGPAARADVVRRACADLDLLRGSLFTRWQALGLARPHGELRALVEEAARIHPWKTDAECVALYSTATRPISLWSWRAHRRRAGLESGHERRRSWIDGEVGAYLTISPDLTAAQIEAGLRADGLPFAIRRGYVAGRVRAWRRRRHEAGA